MPSFWLNFKVLNWIYSSFLALRSEPDDVDLLLFKLWILLDQTVEFWIIEGLRHIFAITSLLSCSLHFPLISINLTFIIITRINETLNIYFQLFLNNKILFFVVYFYISRFWEISLNLHPGFTELILPEDWKVALQQNKL